MRRRFWIIWALVMATCLGLLAVPAYAERLEAVWYSQPGTVGACGKVLGSGPARTYHYVAHPWWPCFERLTVWHGHRHTYAVVADRGPYGGAGIDLARRVFRKLADPGAGRIQVRVVRR